MWCTWRLAHCTAGWQHMMNASLYSLCCTAKLRRTIPRPHFCCMQATGRLRRQRRRCTCLDLRLLEIRAQPTLYPRRPTNIASNPLHAGGCRACERLAGCAGGVAVREST